MRSFFVVTLNTLVLCGAFACTSSTGAAGDAAPADDAGTGTNEDASVGPGGDGGVGTDASDATTPGPGPGPAPVVYAVTIAGSLHKIDLVARTVALVGWIKDNLCEHASPYDIAVDDELHAFISTQTRFYGLDVATSKCAAAGPLGPLGYAGTLAFLPKGTVDPAKQLLVGYVESSFRIVDPTTGASTKAGSIGGGYFPVSTVAMRSGRLFVGASGNGCDDCLIEVSPKTGAIVKNYGSLGRNVTALVSWGETLYGFDGKKLFSVTAAPTASAPVVTDVGELDQETRFTGAASVVVAQ